MAVQPKGPTPIDWGNPITKGLLDAWLPGTFLVQSARGRRPLSVPSNGVEFGYGKYGLGASAVNGSIQYDVGPFAESGTFCVVTIAKFNNADFASIVRRDGALTPVQTDGFGGGTGNVRAVSWDPGIKFTNYTGSVPSPIDVVLVCNRVSLSTQEIWTNGQLVNSRSDFAGYGTTANPLCFLGTEGNGELFNSSRGMLYGVIAFNRALSTSEILSISQDPWQIFKTRSRRTPVSSPASAGYTLSGQAGSFALGGQSISLRFDRKLSAGVGSFALTGQSANLRSGIKLLANAGVFALSGQAANLRRTYVISGGVGSFSLTGQAATLGSGRVMSAAPGSFLLSGQSATLRTGRNLQCSSGSFSLTGQPASLIYTPAGSHVLSAGVGPFSLTGYTAQFRRSLRLGAAPGSFVLNGQSANLYYTQSSPERAPVILTVSASLPILTKDPEEFIIRVPANSCILPSQL